MKRLITTAVLVAATLLQGAVPTMAADMPEPIIEMPEPMPLPAAGAWYLRGDIGYKIYNTPDGRSSNGDYGGLGGVAEFANESMGDAWDFGAGVGYQFNQYFRTDFVIDYETPGEYHGEANCTTCGGGATFSDEYADITAWSGLVNAYADLGTYHGFTPYVGAGVGASYLRTSDTRTSAGGTYGGDEKWNFAWALMAGMSYTVSNNLAVDLGYRYINLGDARSADLAPAGGEVMHVQYNNIDAHEMRVGLRYTFN